MGILDLLNPISFVYQVAQDYSKARSGYVKHFNYIWEQSDSLDPEVFFEGRFKYYKDYYYPRDEDRDIEDAINDQKNVLILGRPLAGKSRAVFEVLKKIEKSCFILKPRPVDIEIENYTFPKLPGNMKKVMFLDDLHIFAEKENFDYLFEVARKNKLIIVATCRSRLEYDFLEKRLPHNLTIESIFDKVVTYDKVPESQAQLIASKLDINWKEAEFDGTIGSLIMKLGPMKTRYKELSQNEKDILRILRRLYCAGISEEGQLFFFDTIQTFAKAKGIISNTNDLNNLLASLICKEFIENPVANVYRVEEIYLERVFDFGVKTQRISIFNDVIVTFSGKPDVLFAAGVKAYSLGFVKLKKSAYMKVAITAYKDALKVYTLAKFPIDYAMTQNNLGTAYSDLAGLKNTKNNLQKAIKAYEEALKVYTSAELPIRYAGVQNNIGSAYRSLARLENSKNNLQKAITAYEKAITACEEAPKVYTLDERLMSYAMTQNNLGIAYDDLAGLEDTKNNLQKAIKAHLRALIVYTLAECPMDCATTQINLGTAYWHLAGLEDTNNNLQKAIIAYEEALKVCTLDELPIKYAMTQNNLGIAYGHLAGLEDTNNNLQKAIIAYEEALKVYTLAEYPMDYATIQNNLGMAYRNLAELKDTNNNLQKAITACEEALKIYTLDELPIQYAMTRNNLGIAYNDLAGLEDTNNNLQKAITACEEALKVCTLDELPIKYAMIQNNLGNAYRNLAGLEDTNNNLQKAIIAYEEALKVYTLEELPIKYAMVLNNLGAAYAILAAVEDTKGNLTKAIKACEAALKIFEREKMEYRAEPLRKIFSTLQAQLQQT